MEFRTETAESATTRDSTAVIETRGLTVYYGANRGIIDVDLSVSRGEVFGSLGPNGAGKTTTQRVLLDIIRPTRGSARVFGLDCRGDGPSVREWVPSRRPLTL